MFVLLGKVLRIDVNRTQGSRAYGIPDDNPFVKVDGVRPEIWASGVRNPWGISFDEDGNFWLADVGQDIWEEVNLIEKGGNYGWKLRESMHPFFPQGVGPRPDLIEPIWEYHHDIGKSITGGHVYRGKKLPELDGHYLYADYVSGKIWALKYDDAARRTVANRPIRDKAQPIMSFGEDEMGEVYLMTYSAAGRGIFHIEHRNAGSFFECEVHAGDLIVVPANTWHFFTLCDEKQIAAVRVFKTKDGWVANYAA